MVSYPKAQVVRQRAQRCKAAHVQEDRRHNQRPAADPDSARKEEQALVGRDMCRSELHEQDIQAAAVNLDLLEEVAAAVVDEEEEGEGHENNAVVLPVQRQYPMVSGCLELFHRESV
jgi:hypothetical protein